MNRNSCHPEYRYWLLGVFEGFHISCLPFYLIVITPEMGFTSPYIKVDQTQAQRFNILSKFVYHILREVTN